jgi:hypothetical protein
LALYFTLSNATFIARLRRIGPNPSAASSMARMIRDRLGLS